MMGSYPGTTWLLFDGDCRVCSAAASWAQALAFPGRLHARPIQDSADLLRELSAEERLGAVHAVATDGRVRSGPDALPLILAAMAGGPGLERLLESSPPARSTLARAYGLLAELRGRLTCGIDGSAPAERTPR